MTNFLVGFPCGFQVTSDFDIQMPVGPRNKSKGYAFIQVEQSETMVALARCLWGRNMPMRASPIPLKIQPAQRVTETSESSEVPAADYAEHVEPPAAASLAGLPPSAGYLQQSGFQFQWVWVTTRSRSHVDSNSSDWEKDGQLWLPRVQCLVNPAQLAAVFEIPTRSHTALGDDGDVWGKVGTTVSQT